MAARKYPKSNSGEWRVELTRGFPYRGTFYRPGAVTVREQLLKVMIAEEGLVSSVVTA